MKSRCISSWPVAVRVAIVRPWKLFMSVTILYRSGPYLSAAYLRAAFMAHSLASAPELPKKTFFRPVLSQRTSASLAQGSEK